jgi:hypothetical protein
MAHLAAYQIIFNVDQFSIYWQALVALADEVAKSSIPEGTRKINGKYIQSHLLSRLEGMSSILVFLN